MVIKRTVGPSRFHPNDESEEPRPTYRRLRFVNPFHLDDVEVASRSAACGAACGVGVHRVRVSPAARCLRGTGESLRTAVDPGTAVCIDCRSTGRIVMCSGRCPTCMERA